MCILLISCLCEVLLKKLRLWPKCRAGNGDFLGSYDLLLLLVNLFEGGYDGCVAMNLCLSC